MNKTIKSISMIGIAILFIVLLTFFVRPNEVQKLQKTASAVEAMSQEEIKSEWESILTDLHTLLYKVQIDESVLDKYNSASITEESVNNLKTEVRAILKEKYIGKVSKYTELTEFTNLLNRLNSLQRNLQDTSLASQEGLAQLITGRKLEIMACWSTAINKLTSLNIFVNGVSANTFPTSTNIMDVRNKINALIADTSTEASVKETLKKVLEDITKAFNTMFDGENSYQSLMSKYESLYHNTPEDTEYGTTSPKGKYDGAESIDVNTEDGSYTAITDKTTSTNNLICRNYGQFPTYGDMPLIDMYDGKYGRTNEAVIQYFMAWNNKETCDVRDAFESATGLTSFSCLIRLNPNQYVKESKLLAIENAYIHSKYNAGEYNTTLQVANWLTNSSNRPSMDKSDEAEEKYSAEIRAAKKERDEARNVKNNIEDEIDELESNITSIKKKINTLEIKLENATTQSRKDELQAQIDRYEDRMDSYERELEDKEDELEDAKEDYADAQDKYEEVKEETDKSYDDGSSESGVVKNSGSEAKELYREAMAYKDFYEDYLNKGKDFDVEDQTDRDEVETRLDQDNYYIVGPFVIDYQKGGYTRGSEQNDDSLEADIHFSGISRMYFVDQDGKEIDIKKFIIEDEEIKARYFDPDKKLFTDEDEQAYPLPGEEFYVKIPYEYNEDSDKVVLRVDFKYLKECYTEAENYDPDTKYIQISRTKCGTNDCDTTGSCWEWVRPTHGSPYKRSIRQHNVYHISLLGPINMNDQYEQPTYDTVDVKRKMGKASLKVTGPLNPEINLRLDIGGYVWNDNQSGKLNDVNGKDDNETKFAGVEVILHQENGTIINSTVTDKDGKYLFKDIDAHKKYYVEFKYDGQLYENTIYTKNLSGGYSNATENSTTRDAFNNSFAEIGSYPNSYKVRTELYYKVGEYNIAYARQDIEAIYNDLIAEAVKLQEYKNAYKAMLSKYGDTEDTRRKLQYIEDCRISAFTGSNGDASLVYYPEENKILVDDESKHQTVNGDKYKLTYAELKNVDFGLAKRELFDLALQNDVYQSTLKINGKDHVYNYDQRKNMDAKYWEISVRQSDAAYHGALYNRELYKSDFDYKISNYNNDNGLNPSVGAIQATLGKDQELRIFVTYKITVRNQSQNGIAEVTELVNYFDKDYRLVENSELNGQFKSYITNQRTNEVKEITWNDTSRYDAATQWNIPEYDGVRTENGTEKTVGKIYTTGTEGIKLGSGQEEYVYVTFEVRKDAYNKEDWIRLDEQIDGKGEANGEGKENIAEINGYRSFYGQNTKIAGKDVYSGYTQDDKIIEANALKASGIVDKDSKAGDVKSENAATFEDDADKAPNVKIIISKDTDGTSQTRQINGNAWEDSRVKNEETSGDAVIGNGVRDKEETLINGVTVQLVELRPEGEFIWKEYKTGQSDMPKDIIGSSGKNYTIANGQYLFASYMPGDFVVRFKYGDSTYTALANANGDNKLQSANADSYNGQDYKTTTYQKSAGTYNANNVSNSLYQQDKSKYSYLYDFSKVGYDKEISNLISDAKDIWSRAGNEAGSGYDTVGSPYYKANRTEVMNYSATLKNHIAEVLASHEVTPSYNGKAYTTDEMNKLIAELIAKTQMRAETGVIVVELEYNREDTQYAQKTDYVLNNVDLGLEERAKSQLVINKTIDHITLALADGEKIIDSDQAALPKSDYLQWVPATDNDNNKLADHQKDIQKRDAGKAGKTQSYRNSYTTNGFGKVELDSIISHGGTLTVTYQFTITNIGETDYAGGNFYYTGVVDAGDKVVTTTSSEVIDYVNNNFGYRQEDNADNWEVVNIDTLQRSNIADSLVNNNILLNVDKTETKEATKAKNTKTIIRTEKLAKALKPGESVQTKLVLSKMITQQNTSDDLTYDNMTEIVEIKNTVGRRQVYSVVGNQDPASKTPSEIDADNAQRINIVPPTGQTRIYYVIGITSAILLIAGIVIIKKKVLTK